MVCPTLKYLITVQHQLNVHIAGQEGQLYIVKPMEGFSINLNVQHVNGMTPFDLTVHSGKLMFAK